MAAKHGHIGFVDSLMRKDPAARDSLAQVLRHAVREGHCDLAVRLFRDYKTGSELSRILKDKSKHKGWTLLHWAAFHGNKECIKSLISPDLKINLNITDKYVRH